MLQWIQKAHYDENELLVCTKWTHKLQAEKYF